MKNGGKNKSVAFIIQCMNSELSFLCSSGMLESDLEHLEEEVSREGAEKELEITDHTPVKTFAEL